MPALSHPGFVKKIASYFFEIRLRKYLSDFSGEIWVSLEQGRKVLNTPSVNYSFNSLHRVFKQAFRQTKLDTRKIKSTLILGLGGGSIIHILRKNYGLEGEIVAVEIDPVIIEIAKTEFNIDSFNPIHIELADAAQFVDSTSR